MIRQKSTLSNSSNFRNNKEPATMFTWRPGVRNVALPCLLATILATTSLHSEIAGRELRLSTIVASDETSSTAPYLHRWQEHQSWVQQIIQEQRNQTLRRIDTDESSAAPFVKDRHPALEPMDPRYAPLPDWNRSIADFNIVGLPKAGTSNLYQILTSHPQIAPFDRRHKEICMARGQSVEAIQRWQSEPLSDAPTLTLQKQQTQKMLHSFHSQMNARHEHTQQKTVNGCVWNFDNELNWMYLRPADKKYIMLFRDPADWLWAAWNFWMQPTIDVDPGPSHRTNNWANAEHFYRSPELFHELVVSGERTLPGAKLFGLRKSTVMTAQRLLAMAGRENVLFLRNEDMMPDQIELGFLRRLANFTELSGLLFPKRTYKQMTNCGDSKGTYSACTKKTGAYAITRGREMWPETRTLLYLQFWEECKIWARDFGIEYPDCLNVVEATEP